MFNALWSTLVSPYLHCHYFDPGRGQKCHVSGFISYPDGKWVDIEVIEPHTDGNWSLEALEAQTQRVLTKLETKYPADKFELVFTFDHSTIHTKLPADALRVTQMNLKPGGSKGGQMRSTVWQGREQTLQFRAGQKLLFNFSKAMPVFDAQGNPVKEMKTKRVRNRKTGEVTEEVVEEVVKVNTRFEAGEITQDGPLSALIGMPKGQQQFLLMERDQWSESGLKAKCGATQKNHHGNCCTTGVMYAQKDFQVCDCMCVYMQHTSINTYSIMYQVIPRKLTEIIRSAGHICLFLPRYHCELAPIERAWSFAKWYCRRYCEYTMDALRCLVPQALAMVNPEKIRQYFNNCFRICSLYAGGMTLNEWLEYDQKRKNMNKKLGRCVGLLRAGKCCEKNGFDGIETLQFNQKIFSPRFFKTGRKTCFHY